MTRQRWGDPYRRLAADAQRLRDLIASSRVKPAPGVSLRDVLAGLPPAQFTEAMELHERLCRTAPRLGLDMKVPG